MNAVLSLGHHLKTKLTPQIRTVLHECSLGHYLKTKLTPQIRTVLHEV